MRVAIVGCGTIAPMHIGALEQIDDVEIVAFCDIIPERAEEAAKEYGGQAFTNYDTMLEAIELDVVHICTPHHLHVDMTEKAAEKGIAVFTEKPPAITWEQWDRLYALRGKVPVGICFQNRYNPCSETLTEIVSSAAAGKILGGKALVTWYRTAEYYETAEWRGKIATEGGGVLINQAIHTLDLLVSCLGSPSHVEATATNRHLKDVIEVEDTVDAYLGYDSGATGLFYASTAYCANSPIVLEVICENVRVRTEDGDVYCYWKDGRVDHITPAPLQVKSKGGQSYWGNAHIVCIADYYDSLRENRPYRNDLESVKATMEATLGIYQSAREQRPVTL